MPTAPVDIAVFLLPLWMPVRPTRSEPLVAPPEYVQGVVGGLEQHRLTIEVGDSAVGELIGAPSRAGVGRLPGGPDQVVALQPAQRAVHRAGVAVHNVQLTKPIHQVVAVVGPFAKQQQ
jgi:hypothetical protein